MSSYRSSTGELGYYDDPPRRGGERWDRDKFERMGRRGRPEHERFHFEDHDHAGRHHHDIEFDRHVDRRGPRVIEREHFHEDDHVHGPPRRHRTDLFEESTPSEIANRALAPYRRKSIVEKDVLDIAPRRPARPQYLRRTSSLDTFDRRPMRRYGDVERIEKRVERKEDWRPPTNVPIPLPIRERRRSPSRMRVREDDFEEIRYREREREPREEYREIEIRRDKSTTRHSKSRRRAMSVRSSRSSSVSSFEEIEVPKPIGKKGKTRMPKRLVKKQAVIELGYPFEEDDDFIIVRRALEKEQIDEVIRISENYQDEKVTYVYEDKKEVVVAPPPPPPPPAEMHTYHVQPAPPPSHYAQSVRSSSPSRHGHETFEERLEESNHIHGPLTMFVPDERRDRRVIRERDVKDEIEALETERRMLKYERERDSEYEIIETKPRREVIRVEKDRKVRRPPNPKVLAAMMTTLT